MFFRRAWALFACLQLAGCSGCSGGSTGVAPVDAGQETNANDPKDGASDARQVAVADADGGAVADRATVADAMVADRSTPPDYHPCPPAPMPCRIMPLGDSITFGIGSTSGAGYRVPLFRKALMAGRSIAFVGSDQNGPPTVDGVPFPPQHEGHRTFIIDTIGGRTGLSPLVPAAITAHTPHIVILMIGTNDAASQIDVANAPRRLGELLDKIFAANASTLVVVAQIIPTDSDATNQRVAAFNAALPAVVAERAAAQKHVVLVDMYGPFVADADFRTSLMTDSLHPNEAGFAKMADVWFAAIGSLLR
jgi:hypothetical protein